MKKASGFTLIEVMIVVAIIGILSMIAVPAYGDYVRRGKIQEAVATLADARVKLEQSYMDNRTYAGGSGAWACGGTAPATRYYTITCTGTDTAYTVTATGIAAQGTNGMVYTINQANVRASTFSGLDGYTSCATRWITKKGEAC
jgi:type IV pilus assembly protein PilE